MKLRDYLRADYDHFLELCDKAPGAALWRMWVNPRTLPVGLIRVAKRLEETSLSPLAALLRLFIMWFFHVEFPRGARIGPGLVLPHPNSIVLGSSEIGHKVVVFQNVTLGAREFDGAMDHSKRPVIGDNVVIGAGAVVLGPVTVGNGSTVAANSLVLSDVPEKTTALGVPATTQ